MKAIVYKQYGSPDVLHLEEIEKPSPKENEVLIKVHAASINSWDRDLLTGSTFVNRLIGGLLKPKYNILGADVAGRVEAVGKNVTRFQPGNEVFGDLCECGWGAFAEYVCAQENALAVKSPGMTFEQAAAIPQGGAMAAQGLLDKKKIKQGDKILINGAGGAVGPFAIQIAKSLGAEVTGVDSAEKFDMMRSIGADHVIDYTQQNYTKTGQRYDLVIDNVALRSFSDYKRVLNPGGVAAVVGGPTGRIFRIAFLGALPFMTGDKKIGLLAHKPNKHLDYINELFEAGKLEPVIDKQYPLSETAEAFRRFGSGDFKGKIIVTV
ncbi:MAG: NAD(P)-dependent alcohol dehydrogenase [bacterium]|nr:NAD(P)-dependent alcohol dehydrogenase [bacterium]